MSKITSFFKQKKQIAIDDLPEEKVEREVNSGTLADQFYKKCAIMQKHACDKADCLDIKAALKLELAKMHDKNRNMKETIEICSEIIAEKDTEIQHLIKKLTTTANVNVEDESIPVDLIEKSPTENLRAFQNVFNPDQLSYLRSVDNDTQKDSHFIKTAVGSLYEGRLAILKNRSVTGRSAGGQAKQKLSPPKHSILTEIFSERIMNATQDSSERVQRQKRLNKLIKDAINNISKSVE